MMSKVKHLIVGVAAVATALVLAPQHQAHALGFGAGVGLVQGQSGPTGDSRGFFGRLGLLGPLDLQVDYAKVDFGPDRADSRFGVGLRLEPFHLGHWVPAVFANTGITSVDAGRWSGRLGFTELGLGIVYAFTDNVRAELDVREGHDTRLTGDEATQPMSVMGSTGSDTYTSGALALSVDF
jgi:hypothetical protein